jgi:hypothetical protein
MGSIIEIVVGAIIAIGITILFEWLKKPKLRIKMLSPNEGDRVYPKHQAKTARFLYMELHNEKLPKLLRFIMRETALQCHGTVVFYHLDGQKVYDREMEVRWSGTPEPVPTILQIEDKQYQIWSNYSIVTRVDICTGECERFDVAAKFDNEVECYGWSNQNYTKGWRNPDWKFNPERYLVRITFISAGEKCTGMYRLVNDVPQKDFRLETALPDDWEKIKL